MCGRGEERGAGGGGVGNGQARLVLSCVVVVTAVVGWAQKGCGFWCYGLVGGLCVRWHEAPISSY